MPYKKGINKDNEAGVYGRDSVTWAYRNGILKEDERHNIHLQKVCTRQEAIQYIKGLYDLLSKKG
ncbi:MAG: hypothetical protein J6S14_15050 [Clostridia bacterium]|nr:hypothetical protein [Clostridia bacterium]